MRPPVSAVIFCCVHMLTGLHRWQRTEKQAEKTTDNKGEEDWGGVMSYCQQEVVFGLDHRVCVCARMICSFPLSSMSSCQNKLITITGAKPGIQKFISSTICIVSLSSATVCMCVCSPVICVFGTARCRHSNQHSYLLLCHGFSSPCVVELKCSPSLCWRFELQRDSCSKNSSLRSRDWQLLQQRHDRQGEKL